jgi:hypothetical protein
MERGSDKHSPRLDEAIKHETAGLTSSGQEPHIEEWRQPEPSGEDQPEVGVDPTGQRHGGTPAGMSAADVEGRSELARYLGRSAFPGVGAALFQAAREAEAPERVLDRLRRLPSGREYRNVNEVWSAIGGHVETQRN